MSKMTSEITSSHSRSTMIAVGATVAVLVIAGLVHRSLLGQIQGALGQSLKLARPLSTLPLQLGPWQGRDVPVDDRVRRIAGDDDFISREYQNDHLGRTVGLYVGYIGRPRTWMSHRPDICYQTHGAEQTSEESQSLHLPDGSTIPCFVYEFKWPQLGGPRQIVLATYLFNGQFVKSLDRIRDTSSRHVGPLEKQAAYVARIQVSITATGNREKDIQLLHEFATGLQGHILALLPGSPKAD